MRIDEIRFYTEQLGIKNSEGKLPVEIEKKHDILIDLYRKRGYSSMPDYLMMMIAADYVYDNPIIENEVVEDAVETPVVAKGKPKGRPKVDQTTTPVITPVVTEE